MCSIVGHLAFQSDHKIGEPLLNALNQLLIHRGPDSGGTFLKDEIALAMRRLSIIDLDGGAQPMTSQDGKYTNRQGNWKLIDGLFLEETSPIVG